MNSISLDHVGNTPIPYTLQTGKTKMHAVRLRHHYRGQNDWSSVPIAERIYNTEGGGSSQTGLASPYITFRRRANEGIAVEETHSHPRVLDPYGQLYAHLQRRHVGMISIGGTIGTGLFLHSGQAIANGGPLGALLAYATFGTVAYSLIVSISEMSAAFPDIGGPVGLADRFVDPALGFATGWIGLYKWCSLIPAQVAAAIALVNYWDPPARLAALWPAIFLIIIISVNVGGARRYGEIEFVFSILKILTIIALVIIGIAINLGAGDESYIGFKHWGNPGPFSQYLGIEGAKGRFLGFWAVFMQASFSYFGCETPAFLSSEVRNAHWAVPRASRNTFVKLTVLYLSAIFVAGLLVPHDICMISSDKLCKGERPSDNAPWRGSPFLIALEMAGAKFAWIKHVFVACFLISAVSAASAEAFICSRHFYYLAKSGYAPRFFGAVYPRHRKGEDRKGASVPCVGLAFAMSFALFSFMTIRPGVNKPLRIEKVFRWAVSMGLAASLKSWIGLLFTYIRFYQGTEHPRNKSKFGREIAWIKRNRAPCQPWLAIYALLICGLILLFHGWSVFAQSIIDDKKWVIYETMDQKGMEDIFPKKQVAVFVTTYLPMPLFLLLAFGYKLINQTRIVSIEDMNFAEGCGLNNATDLPNDSDGRETKPQTWYGKLWWFLVS